MATSSLTLQLLAWVAEQPRSYQETMEAWRTSCPRRTIWEDAVSEGLLSVEAARSMKDGRVRLTESGRMLLTKSTEPAS